MTSSVPDTWQETCLIGIIPEGETEIAFAGITKDISGFEFGSKGISREVLVNGGQVAKYEPMDVESIELEVFPVDALLDTAGVANGVVQMFHPQSTEDTTQPVLVDNTLTRKKHGLILLWCTILPATAGAIPALGEPAYRIEIINAYMTEYNLDYTDKFLMGTLKFSWTPFQKDASANKREESTNGDVQLPAAITTATSF